MPDFDRITQDPRVMRGRPCIRGMRVTVAMIAGHIGGGYNVEQLLSDYPYLELEDVHQALSYARSHEQGTDIETASA